MEDRIVSIQAIEILSGIGRPTVEVELTTSSGIVVEASVPSGTSKGKYESYELYDGGSRLGGRGVRKAVENVNQIIAPELIGKKVTDQALIDLTMINLDGTANKERLGGNAILPVSVAVAKAGAAAAGLPVYRYLGGLGACRLPVPIATVVAGGKYSSCKLDFEDYLLIMDGFNNFSEALEALVETRYCLEKILAEKYGTIADVGGALAPPLSDTREAFDWMLKAIELSGYNCKIHLGLDVAGTELLSEDKQGYRVNGRILSTDELIEYYINLSAEYPLVFIEDPFEQDDFVSFANLTRALPQAQIVGDDLFVTNPLRIKMGYEQKACNTLLLKVNQIGTVTEACQAASLAKEHFMGVTVSLRSSDTNDHFIADLAVGIGANQIKLGSPVRGERNAKYNRLLKIESELKKLDGFTKYNF